MKLLMILMAERICISQLTFQDIVQGPGALQILYLMPT